MDTFQKVLLSCLIGIILLASVCTYIQCGKEAEFYTKITGVEVTRADAFWLDLDPSKHVVQVEQEQR